MAANLTTIKRTDGSEYPAFLAEDGSEREVFYSANINYAHIPAGDRFHDPETRLKLYLTSIGETAEFYTYGCFSKKTFHVASDSKTLIDAVNKLKV
jgi:hypothetical protein